MAFICPHNGSDYRAPRRNTLDKLSDTIEDVTEDAMGDG